MATIQHAVNNRATITFTSSVTPHHFHSSMMRYGAARMLFSRADRAVTASAAARNTTQAAIVALSDQDVRRKGSILQCSDSCSRCNAEQSITDFYAGFESPVR